MTPGSYLDASTVTGRIAARYLELLLAGERRAASSFILDAVEEGLSIRDAYLEVFQPVLWELGRLWETNEVSVAQEHFCTAATQLVMSQLYPRLFGGERTGRRMVAASVGDNLHEIGVRMVSDFFEMEGWDTLYLGASIPAAEIAAEARAQEADLVAVSATLDEHLPEVERVIAALKEARDAGEVRILVGGAPFREDPGLWKRMGADASGSDALEAVAAARRLFPS